MPISFLTNEQFLVRYDWRWVAKNVLDSQYGSGDASVATRADLLDDSSDAGSVLAALIEEASEVLMAAAAVGARYSVSDLTTYGGSLLLRIVSDLTLGLILKRRARAAEDVAKMAPSYAEALEYLEQLRRGERIFFAVPEVPEAGLPDTASMNPVPGVNPPTVTQMSQRYFGAPAGSAYPWWNTN